VEDDVEKYREDALKAFDFGECARRSFVTISDMSAAIVKPSEAYMSCLRERRALGGRQRFLAFAAGLETQRAVS
jgi:hypothetical protein